MVISQDEWDPCWPSATGSEQLGGGSVPSVAGTRGAALPVAVPAGGRRRALPNCLPP